MIIIDKPLDVDVNNNIRVGSAQKTSQSTKR